jgi:hypothetical protein
VAETTIQEQQLDGTWGPNLVGLPDPKRNQRYNLTAPGAAISSGAAGRTILP